MNPTFQVQAPKSLATTNKVMIPLEMMQALRIYTGDLVILHSEKDQNRVRKQWHNNKIAPCVAFLRFCYRSLSIQLGQACPVKKKVLYYPTTFIIIDTFPFDSASVACDGKTYLRSQSWRLCHHGKVYRLSSTCARGQHCTSYSTRISH